MEAAPFFFMLCVLHLYTATALPPCNSQLRLHYPEYFTHCDCTHLDWSEWEMVDNSTVNVRLDQCISGQAYSEMRRQEAIGEGCTDKTETRLVCMPDDIDRIIMTLGLGSSGHDYGSTSLEPTAPPGPTAPPYRPIATAPLGPTAPPYRPTSGTHGTVVSTLPPINPFTVPSPPINFCSNEQVCQAYTEPRGKRSIGEERFGKKLSWNHRPLQGSAVAGSSDMDPLPFEWNKHHHRFRRQLRSCDDETVQYILFLLDTSGSIGLKNFEIIKNGISRLVTLVCKQVRIAVMTFNHEYNIEFCFDCHYSNCNGRADAVDAIKAIKYRRGWTHTGGATKCACNFLLSPSCGLPSDASCIDVVYITDGKSNDPSVEVCDEVHCLHNHFGVNTYAIGIGNRVDQDELNCITEPGSSTSTSIFNFESFEQFEKALDMVFERLLNDSLSTTPGDPQYTCLTPVNTNSTTGKSCLE